MKWIRRLLGLENRDEYAKIPSKVIDDWEKPVEPVKVDLSDLRRRVWVQKLRMIDKGLTPTCVFMGQKQYDELFRYSTTDGYGGRRVIDLQGVTFKGLPIIWTGDADLVHVAEERKYAMKFAE